MSQSPSTQKMTQNVSNVLKSTQITMGKSMGHIKVYFRVPFVKNEGNGTILECRITFAVSQNRKRLIESVMSNQLLHILSHNQLEIFAALVYKQGC